MSISVRLHKCLQAGTWYLLTDQDTVESLVQNFWHLLRLDETKPENCLHPRLIEYAGSALSNRTDRQRVCKHLRELDAMLCRHEDAPEEEGQRVPQHHQGPESGHANKLPLHTEHVRHFFSHPEDQPPWCALEAGPPLCVLKANVINGRLHLHVGNSDSQAFPKAHGGKEPWGFRFPCRLHCRPTASTRD